MTKKQKEKIFSIIIFVIIALVYHFFIDNETETINNSKDNTREVVTLKKCVDGDTAVFNDPVGKTRFLFVDTPESTIEIEPFGKEASAYTCNALETASKIEIEYDGETKDKYDRTLGWIYVDGKLLQEQLALYGLVEDFYDYGDYKYEEKIVTAFNDGSLNHKGIYSDKSFQNVELIDYKIEAGESHITIKTKAKEECEVQFKLPSGSVSSAKGLGNKKADTNGLITWTWNINASTQKGTSITTIVCKNGGTRFAYILK